MSEKPYTTALFASLVYNEAGELAEVAYIGPEAHYVILDGDFRRHVAAKEVDEQVIHWFQEQIISNKDLVTESMMTMLGKDDLFTKAMIDSSITKMDSLLETGIPEDAKIWLGMMGFKIIVNVHGEVVEITAPTQTDFDDSD
jgi:uncharacterized protein YbaA (DUF1428 family)